MKGMYLVLSLVLLASMLLIPLLAIPGEQQATPPASSGTSSVDIADEHLTNEKADHFLVYNPETQKTEKIAAADYVFRVVAAEMPASYHEEALKAQAVAAYTFACRKRALRLGGKSDHDYDITTDSSQDQAYITPEELKTKWGDKYDEYTEKIQAAVEATSGYMLTYEGSPIFAAYHAISSGKTESSGNVWSVNYPYLKPVESVGDLLSPSYLSEVSLTSAEFKEKLKDTCTLDDNPAGWVAEPTRSDSGTVLSCSIGGKLLTGKEIRTLFDLKSANFDLKFADDKFTFTVRGHGHDVGMSQYGANYMALQGSDFLEILSWYYTGCTLEK